MKTVLMSILVAGCMAGCMTPRLSDPDAFFLESTAMEQKPPP
jgi:hypothetical protein